LLLLVTALFTGCKSSSSQKAASKPEVVTGVGLFLARDQATGEFMLRRTFPNSPAARANLPLNTILYRVDGVFVQPMKINEVSKLVLGPEGTKVFLEFVDPVTRQMSQVTITRARFANNSR
jgi:C-terminal processing protease CtpA/Prc